MNLTRAEFNGFSSKINSRISALQTASLTFEKEYPISLSDLGSDITTLWNPSQYWLKGEPITRGLSGVVDLDYVTSRTVGEVNTTYDFNLAIDELVNAREGKTSFIENLHLYSLKTELITNINAISTGTINKARQEPHDHNDTTLRDATGCHSISDITDLTDTLADLTEDDSVIEDINDSLESTKILVSQIDTIDHTDHISDRDSSNCHEMTAITDLMTEIQKGTDAAAYILASLGGYASLLLAVQCIFEYILALDPTEAFAPPCWISLL